MNAKPLIVIISLICATAVMAAEPYKGEVKKGIAVCASLFGIYGLIFGAPMVILVLLAAGVFDAKEKTMCHRPGSSPRLADQNPSLIRTSRVIWRSYAVCSRAPFEAYAFPFKRSSITSFAETWAATRWRMKDRPLPSPRVMHQIAIRNWISAALRTTLRSATN